MFDKNTVSCRFAEPENFFVLEAIDELLILAERMEIRGRIKGWKSGVEVGKSRERTAIAERMLELGIGSSVIRNVTRLSREALAKIEDSKRAPGNGDVYDKK